jgi:hypothetical protein
MFQLADCELLGRDVTADRLGLALPLSAPAVADQDSRNHPQSDNGGDQKPGDSEGAL